MKKILSLAMATMFAFAVSAQTTTAEKPKSETKKVEKTSAVKMNTPEKKEEAKKSETQASTAKVHKAHPVKRDMKAKGNSDQAKRNHARKTVQLTTKAPAEIKSEKSTPVVK